jgi:hypothetical protein
MTSDGTVNDEMFEKDPGPDREAARLEGTAFDFSKGFRLFSDPANSR